jgi:hypothetical protein
VVARRSVVGIGALLVPAVAGTVAVEEELHALQVGLELLCVVEDEDWRGRRGAQEAEEAEEGERGVEGAQGADKEEEGVGKARKRGQAVKRRRAGQ